MTGLNEGLAIKINSSNNYYCYINFSINSLFWFLNKTKTGKSMRAYSDNEDLAYAIRYRSKKNSHDHLDHCWYFGYNWWSFVWFR